ncbi:MAG: hypothetical protein KA053_04500 [Lentimicrobiaceae bacterium]|nr:hypothetical protein [Lentimicrobiaceae bacterium]
MTNKETVERNIGLTFDFVNELIENPALTENLPDDFKLEFIEKDFPTLERKDDTRKEQETKKKRVKVRNTFDFL